jgi:hypothetical protein
LSESRSETTQQNIVRGGVSGTRSNEAMTISDGSGGGTRLDETQEESTFLPKFPTTTELTEDPGGRLEGVSVMLGVPRSYVQRLLEIERPPPAEGESAEPPTAAEVTQRFEQVRSDLEQRIEVVLGNIVSGEPGDVAVTVSMLSDLGGVGTASTVGGLGTGAGLGGGMGGALGLGSGMIDKIVLGVLATVSLAMMALLVRKATKRHELPTAEELVGIPPALQADGDLFGEADEGDVAMSGIELDEDRVQTNKMLEQVGELLESSPETAASLLQGWISASED